MRKFQAKINIPVALRYLSQYLHLVHGLQPTLDKFSGAKN